jgi:hypothetical protein
MAVKGMDVEGGRQSATVITQGAEQLDGLTQQLTGSIQGFEWMGPDADRTRETWNSEYVRTLQMVSQTLRDFATLINNQAQEQEQVSNA